MLGQEREIITDCTVGLGESQVEAENGKYSFLTSRLYSNTSLLQVLQGYTLIHPYSEYSKDVL